MRCRIHHVPGENVSLGHNVGANQHYMAVQKVKQDVWLEEKPVYALALQVSIPNDFRKV